MTDQSQTAAALLDCLESGIAKLERQFSTVGKFDAADIMRAMVGVLGYVKALDARIAKLERVTDD